ncbi:MAG: right-handed parallel beta-helix repeat-containing protein [bacterium]|nr:right-handed parallel beta-helix repeat-containing protein [bacterium]
MKSICAFAFVVFLLTCAVSASSAVWYVDGSLSASGDGRSWGGAFIRIQRGLDSASDGDTVHVAPGTYKGTGNKNLDFLGKALTLRSRDGAEFTIIDSEALHPAFHFCTGETVSSVLEGFTVKNGPVGILCSFGKSQSRGSEPTIINCHVVGNLGDGIRCEDSSPTITDCVISDNGGNGVGAYEVYGFGSGPRVEGCTISNNEGQGVMWARQIVACTISGNQGGGCSGDIIQDSVIAKNTRTKGGGVFRGWSIVDCFISENVAEEGAGIWGPCDIVGCTISRNRAVRGGGVYYFDAGGPTERISESVFTENVADYGGAIYFSAAFPKVEQCNFVANVANKNGGAVFVNAGTFAMAPDFVACIFSSNRACYGAAMHMYYGAGWIAECKFFENAATEGGGGVCFESAEEGVPSWNDCLMVNSVLARNSAAKWGGAVYCYYSAPRVLNCTIADNVGAPGGGVYCELSAVTVHNTILWGDEASEIYLDDESSCTALYSDIQGGTGKSWFGEGCISWDPLLTEDYQLREGSPCIDTGDNDAAHLPDKDMKGMRRIMYGKTDLWVDMGAYEYFSFPSGPVAISTLPSGNTQLAWDSHPGDVYVVWSRIELSMGTWGQEATISSGGSVTLWTDGVSVEKRKFYRVELR